MEFYSPIFFYAFVGAYHFVVLIVPFLVARLLVLLVTTIFKWEPEKKTNWKWSALLAMIWISHPWFSVVEDINGRVVDINGQPIAGVLITARWNERHVAPGFSMKSAYSIGIINAKEAVTDVDGRFQVVGFTTITPFNRKLERGEPDIRFYKEGMRIDNRLTKVYSRDNKVFFDRGILRQSRWNGLDMVMVEMDKDSQQSRSSEGLGGFIEDVLEERSCMWINIPNTIIYRKKPYKNGIRVSGDFVYFMPPDGYKRSMKDCGVDADFFKGLDEWNIKYE